jgi:hypothetical protein
MPAKKWALDEQLTFLAARNLTERPPVTVGASLGWGGLKVFRKGVLGDKSECYMVKKGCVVLATLFSNYTGLLAGNWRSELAFKVVSALSPLPLKQFGQDWYLIRPGHGDIPVLFVDGMIVGDACISPCIPWTPASKSFPSAAARETFTEYVDYICRKVDDVKFEYPSAMGCWECYFYTTPVIEGSRLPRGAEPEGVKHLFVHARKKTIESSLIWRSVQEDGLKPDHHWDRLVGNSHQYSANVTALRDHLFSYFRRRLGQLGAYQLWTTTSHDSRPSKSNRTEVRAEPK